jgi:thioredoxin reductase (NADPH)
MDLVSPDMAFPRLPSDEIELVRTVAQAQVFREGDFVFKAGQKDIDLFVIERGAIEVINPTDHNRPVVMHGPGEFTGDIDLLTRRPTIVTGIARGETSVLRVPGSELRRLLGTVPKLGERLITAFTIRRQMLEEAGIAGIRVVGLPNCPDTTLVREFLFKNWVPYVWFSPEAADGKAVLAELGGAGPLPAIECSPGNVLRRPTIKQLARCAGISRPCPDRVFDLAIVGAGPAGMAAAVYAASEGLSTVVLDRLGPGGQAGGSSLIENFIGFPSGLSGNDLAARGLLQMLKFGALLLAPITVESLEPGEGDNPHVLHTDDAAVRASVVMIATGAKWRRLSARNAERFERNGIFYSATAVEQRLCASKPVMVVGAGNSGGQAAMFLSECSPKVYFLVHGSELGPGMSSYLVQRIRANPRIEVITDAEVTELHGAAGASGAATSAANPTLTAATIHTAGKDRTVDVSAIFVFIGAEPHTAWLPDSIARDEKGYILTGDRARHSPLWKLDRSPCELETTMPKVLAAGDARAGSTKRVGFAVGDGSLAVTCVHRLRG